MKSFSSSSIPGGCPVRDTIIINHKGFYPPLKRALESQGLKTTDQDWFPSGELLQRSLVCVVWFYDCLRHPVKIWHLQQRLKRYSVPLFAWNRDAPHYLNRKPWRLNLLNRFQLLDIYATHTLVDTKRYFAKSWMYFPNGANLACYGMLKPKETLARLRQSSQYQWDVSFFGSMDGMRHKEMQSRQEFFAALALRLDSLGVRYRFQEAAGMTMMEQIALIHASRINLNFGACCEYGAKEASGLPERCYGIPAAGGFLLCDRRSHAQNDFTPGQNWAEFDGLDDCVDRINYWLGHFDEARTMAEQCHFHTVSKHSYDQRARKLMVALSNWHEGKRGRLA